MAAPVTKPRFSRFAAGVGEETSVLFLVLLVLSLLVGEII